MLSEGEVRTILGQVIKTAEINAWDVNYDFRDSALDSLDHANLALLLEEKHGLMIPDEALPQLNTIRAILDYAGSLAVRAEPIDGAPNI